jgi:hypothetical protein
LLFTVIWSPELNSAHVAARKHPPDHQNYDGADNGAYQPRPFTWLVPSHGLPEISGNESARDSEQRGYNEAGWLIRAGVKDLRDYSCQKTYDQRPKNTHNDLQLR